MRAHAAPQARVPSALVPRLGAPLASGLVLLALACAPTESFNGEVVEPAGDPLELTGTNWDGEPFRLASQRGKVTVVFFGYTYCPDVCPFTLAKMKTLYRKLGDRAEEVAVVFASVDPERDSVTKLAEYVSSFDPRFYGVRLEGEDLEAAREELGLTVTYGQPKQGPGTDSYYYVDHTGTFFVLDREGRLRLKYPPTVSVEKLLPDLERLLRG